MPGIDAEKQRRNGRLVPRPPVVPCHVNGRKTPLCIGTYAPYALLVDPDALRSVQFREQFRGYAPAEVDDAIERLAARLEAGGEIRRVDVDQLRFATARLRGYHRGDVDSFVQRLRDGAR